MLSIHRFWLLNQCHLWVPSSGVSIKIIKNAGYSHFIPQHIFQASQDCRAWSSDLGAVENYPCPLTVCGAHISSIRFRVSALILKF